jgi:uncharacterized membrane protein YebE (DUF533 family)
MNLLRVVTAMAWSDGGLATAESEMMLDRFSELFATSAPQQQQLRQELQDYMMQNIPLEELIPHLQTQAEKELVLRLGYEVICSSSRAPGEAAVNADEAAAFEKLAGLLELPTEVVQQIKADVEATLGNEEPLVDRLTRQLGAFKN